MNRTTDEQKVILRTAFLPPISYMAAVAAFGDITVEAHENYEKQSYRNRVRILTDQGVRDLSIPIKHAGGLKIPVTEALISDHQAWRRNLWRTVKAAYGASPYFPYYSQDLEKLLMSGSSRLFELNLALLHWALNTLRINCRVRLSECYQLEPAARDLRNHFHPKKPLPVNPPYSQVFSDRMPFIPGLSALDLIFNLGPEGKKYLIEFGKSLYQSG